jgi:N6-L-threonylcarbamoyladenine synthase
MGTQKHAGRSRAKGAGTDTAVRGRWTHDPSLWSKVQHRGVCYSSRMLILGIETSCDDTGAAVLQVENDTRRLLSNVLSSQVVHQEYGGVVPELASRAHLTALAPIVRRALERAGVGLEDLAAVAATSGPGLIGSLLVGLTFAKSLAWARGLAFVSVNHIEAHLLAVCLEAPDLAPPFLGLVVSGGHTEFLLVEDWGCYRLLGSTLDDAAGEAFDKVGTLLGLPYPGGPNVERAARLGDPHAFRLPRGLRLREDCDVSFSGLKTAVRTLVERLGSETTRVRTADLAASFQEAVVESLEEKFAWALRHTGVTHAVLAGGVAANSALRDRLRARADREGAVLHLPSLSLCTDNAAMIALVGSLKLTLDGPSSWDVPAVPAFDSLPLSWRRT